MRYTTGSPPTVAASHTPPSSSTSIVSHSPATGTSPRGSTASSGVHVEPSPEISTPPVVQSAAAKPPPEATTGPSGDVATVSNVAPPSVERHVVGPVTTRAPARTAMPTGSTASGSVVALQDEPLGTATTGPSLPSSSSTGDPASSSAIARTTPSTATSSRSSSASPSSVHSAGWGPSSPSTVPAITAVPSGPTAAATPIESAGASTSIGVHVAPSGDVRTAIRAGCARPVAAGAGEQPWPRPITGEQGRRGERARVRPVVGQDRRDDRRRIRTGRGHRRGAGRERAEGDGRLDGGWGRARVAARTAGDRERDRHQRRESGPTRAPSGRHGPGWYRPPCPRHPATRHSERAQPDQYAAPGAGELSPHHLHAHR